MKEMNGKQGNILILGEGKKRQQFCLRQDGVGMERKNGTIMVNGEIEQHHLAIGKHKFESMEKPA